MENATPKSESTVRKELTVNIMYVIIKNEGYI